MPLLYKHYTLLSSLFLGWVIQMFIPYFNYNKFIRDAFSYTSKSVGRVGPTCKVIDGSWFGWTEIASVSDGCGCFRLKKPQVDAIVSVQPCSPRMWQRACLLTALT